MIIKKSNKTNGFRIENFSKKDWISIGKKAGWIKTSAYKITLTPDERKAFDWIGERYGVGDAGNLISHFTPEGQDWDDPREVITFDIPEHVAWNIKELIEEDMEGGHGIPIVGRSLKLKLYEFIDNII